MMEGSATNLRALFALSDMQDRIAGAAAYSTYNRVIRSFADHYGFSFERAHSAFVALSPNSDYFGNLRSLASVLAGARDGLPLARITVATYKHCRDRAYSYATGETLFLHKSKGLKVRAFFFNILDPADPKPVTVDGHIMCAWRGINAPMKESLVRRREYERVAAAVRRLARAEGMLPNQAQATLWLTRKRIQRVKFNPQLDLFFDPMLVTPAQALPYQPTRN